MATQYTAGLTTGQVLTAATMNSIGAAWETYTPTWSGSVTNPAIGNGTLSGTYARINKMLVVSILLITGSTTTYGSGLYRFSMPTSIVQNQAVMGWGVLLDASASYASYNSNLIVSTSATTVEAYFTNGLNPFSPTFPVTFAPSDQFRMTLIGQVA